MGQFIASSRLLYEPMGKNTAPCIGWAALEILNQDPEGIMVVMPADHYIQNNKAYAECIKKAVEAVNTDPDKLVTIGIRPTHAHTGFGYIEVQDADKQVMSVQSFTEKPDKETAETYIESGRYFWNSGIFIWKAKTITEILKSRQNTNHQILQELSQLDEESRTNDALSSLYNQLTSISIDYAVMELESQRTLMIPSTFDWHDIGNWTSVEPFWKDETDNSSRANLLPIDSKNNIVYSKKR